MEQTVIVFATLSLGDANHWPQLAERARELGALAATLQGSGPSITTQLDDLAAQGVAHAVLVGVTFEQACEASWLNHVGRWWLANNDSMRVSGFARALRGLPSSLPDPAGAKALRAKATILENPTWEHVMPAACQVLVCTGPRCQAKGQGAMIRALGDELHARGLLTTDVLITQTGCLYPCNQAPVVALQPDMTWLGPVLLEDVSALADRIEANLRGAKRATSTPLRTEHS